MTRLVATAVALAGAASFALTGCAGKREAAAPPAPIRVENAALGIAVAALPDGVTVEANEGALLRFSTSGAAGGGRLTLTVGPSGQAVDVVAEAKRGRAELEALSGAVFAGGNELVTPAGAGYAVRGSHLEGGVRFEERRIYALHPDGSGRLLTLVERYPAADAKDASARFGRALALLGELEPYPPRPTG